MLAYTKLALATTMTSGLVYSIDPRLENALISGFIQVWPYFLTLIIASLGYLIKRVHTMDAKLDSVQAATVQVQKTAAQVAVTTAKTQITTEQVKEAVSSTEQPK